MNRLEGESSPYLRQHASNPVDWHPWGDEAFALARERDVPIFLSIGYSACHWCHVMAHESFEDDATAQDLNEGFVAVKVDREERPDVDSVYMSAVQAMTGGGGWPMSVFLTPDGRPFYAGTYFPPVDRAGMPSFRRVLDALGTAWSQRRPDVERQADALAEAVSQSVVLPTLPREADDGEGPGPLQNVHGPGAAERPYAKLLRKAVSDLERQFDERFGGFGSAPKFPQPSLTELCLQHARLSPDGTGMSMATKTLRGMSSGGIYDHLGGGFARYSTDAAWTVPHFEKMLYDQATLVRVFLHAWELTGEATWRQVVEETVEYVLRDLAHPAGGFFSAEDADSEGEEGRFYTWTPGELKGVLDAGPAQVAAEWYGVTERGNFEGRSILRRPPGDTIIRPPEVEAARAELFEARQRRVRPGLDDKILTEWNAMFCSSLAEAAASMGNERWARVATRLATFLWDEMRRAGDGRLLRSWQGGRARHLAYAADYAWMVDCFTRTAELTGEAHWVDKALWAAAELQRLFRDDGGGAFFTSGSDAERLVVRPLDLVDGAIPSANSVAATALLRLGAVSGEQGLIDTGAEIVSLVADLASRNPLALANAVSATGLVDGGSTEVVIPGESPDMVHAVQSRYEPNVVVAWGEARQSALWEGRQNGNAYVCRGFVCHEPVQSSDALVGRLEGERSEQANELARIAALD